MFKVSSFRERHIAISFNNMITMLELLKRYDKTCLETILPYS